MPNEAVMIKYKSGQRRNTREKGEGKGGGRSVLHVEINGIGQESSEEIGKNDVGSRWVRD